jgi:hypothetical protein
MALSLGDVNLHRVGGFTIDGSRLMTLTVSGLDGEVKLRDSSCESLRCHGQGSVDAEVELLLSRVEIANDIEVENVTIHSIQLEDVNARNLRLNRVRVAETVRIKNASFVGSVDLIGIASESTTAVELCDCRVTADLTAREIDNIGGHDVMPVADVLRTTVAGDASFEAVRARQSVVLADCRLRGSLVLTRGDAVYRLLDGTSISGLDLPAAAFRTPRAVREFAMNRLGMAGVLELATLRSALQDRPDEEDAAYYALRFAQNRSQGGWLSQLEALVKGGTLGWGVRLWPPVRALVAGIAVTTLLLQAVGRGESAHVLSSGGFARNLLLSTALWINVGVGEPSELTGAWWTLVGVVLATFGLTLITVTVGIVIRRLVR